MKIEQNAHQTNQLMHMNMANNRKMDQVVMKMEVFENKLIVLDKSINELDAKIDRRRVKEEIKLREKEG
jgi:hypothetical protein